MRLTTSLFLAVLGIAFTCDTARATHCGACRFPRAMHSAHQVCMPQVQYKVCYQTVCEDRVCVKYRPVYQTTMKECRYTTYEPVYERHIREHRYTVCKPVWTTEHVKQCYTVCKPV